MNWIDEKYKDTLGNRKFPDNLREQGKKDLETLLAKEMPVTKPIPKRTGWFYVGMSLLIVALLAVPVGLWYWSTQGQAENEVQIQQQPAVVSEPQNDKIIIPPVDGTKAGSEAMEEKADLYGKSPESMDLKSREANETIAEKTQIVQSPEIGPTQNSDIAKSLAEGQQTPESQNADKPEGKAQASTNIASNHVLENRGEISSPKPVLTNTSQNESLKSKDADMEISGAAPAKAKDETQRSEMVLEDSAPNKGKETIDKSEEMGNEEDQKSNDALVKTSELQEENNQKMVAESEPAAEEKVAVESLADEEGPTPASTASTSAKLTNLAFAEFENGSALNDASVYKLTSAKRLAISLWGGYTFVGKQVKGGSPAYLAKRKEGEDAIWTVPTGMTIDYFINQNWTFSVGAGWSEYGEELNYPYIKTDSVLRIDGRYDTPRNYSNVTYLDSVRRVDSINLGHWEYNLAHTTEDTAIKNNNGRSSWSYVEIPVLLGYRFGSKRLKPWVQTGVSVGIPFASNFRYLSAKGEGLQNLEDVEAYKPPMQFNYLFQLGVDYYLTRHFSLRLNAFGSYQINPSFKFEGVEQRYYRIGGTIGIGYNF